MFVLSRAQWLQSLQAHEDHASELVSALLEERRTHEALCPQFIPQDHWRDVHDAIAIMTLHHGQDQSSKLLNALARPWWPEIDEEHLHDHDFHVGLFETYQGRRAITTQKT